MIAHRPPAELLLGYASGTLSEPLALAIAAHAALCPETAAEIRQFEGAGGTLLERLDPTALRGDALERTLAALDDPSPAPLPVKATTATRALLPPPLWPYVKGDVATLRWRRHGRHIATADLAGVRGARSAFLLRVTGGRPVPRHTHKGAELTLVLRGAYSDAGQNFARGDVQVTDPTVDHQPIAREGEDCICLVALEAPIRFTGPLGRLANPFVRL